MGDRQLIFIVFLMFMEVGLAQSNCYKKQKPRMNLHGETICCYTAVCRPGQRFSFCTENGGHDTCQNCPAGYTHQDPIYTEQWEDVIDPCIEEFVCEEYPDLRIIDGICSCDRLKGYYGHDIHRCLVDNGGCKGPGYELTMDGTCQKCDKNHFKEKEGEYGLCIKKTRCSEDQEVDNPGSISSDRTCKTRIKPTSQPAFIDTTQKEPIISRNNNSDMLNRTNVPETDRNSTTTIKKTDAESSTEKPKYENKETKENNESFIYTVVYVFIGVVIVGLFITIVMMLRTLTTNTSNNSHRCCANIFNIHCHVHNNQQYEIVGSNVQMGDNCTMKIEPEFEKF